MSREGEAEEGGSRPFRSFVARGRARARIEESSVTRTGPPRARSMEVRGSQPRTTRGRYACYLILSRIIYFLFFNE